MKLNAGTEIERYVIESQIGSGGIGRVYKVRHTKLGTLHALKVVQRDDEKTLKRLLNEGRYQASVNHPGIVSVTDVIDVNGSPGLIMEYVNGPSIFELLKLTRLSVDQISILGSRIMEAVATAHDLGLVHRDLKPGNILISVRNRDVYPKICDFGIAKALATDTDDGSLTNTGHMMGTPAYMAPEQFLNAKDVDHRADIFALGVIMYKLVAKCRPFVADNPIDYYRKMTESAYRPLEPSSEIPERFITAIDFALRPAREDRAQDARHLQLIWEGKATPENVATVSEDHETPWDTGFFQRASTSEVPISQLPDASTLPLKKSPGPAPREAAEQDATLDPKANLTGREDSPSINVTAIAGLVLVFGFGLILVIIAALNPIVEPPSNADLKLVVPELGEAPPAQREPTVVESAKPTPPDTPMEAPPTPEMPPVQAGPVPPVTAKPTTPTPSPKPKQRPTEPKADAEPSELREPAAVTPPVPEPAPSNTATVTLKGDPAKVWLRNDSGNFPAGEVPPGTYQISVVFGDDKPIKAGVISVNAGQTVQLNCVAALRTCR